MRLFGLDFSAVRVSEKNNKYVSFRIYSERADATVLSFEIGKLFYPGFVYRTASVDDARHNFTLSLGLFMINGVLPFKNKNPKYRLGDDMEDYALAYGGWLNNRLGKGFPDSLCYYDKAFGKYTIKEYAFPWAQEFSCCHYLDENLVWVTDPEAKRHTIERDFTYVTKYGKEQKTKVTASLSRYFFNAKSPLFNVFPKCFYHLDIDFETSIGEDVDSWKGGTTAVSVPLDKISKSVDIVVMMPKYLNDELKKLQDNHDI